VHPELIEHGERLQPPSTCVWALVAERCPVVLAHALAHGRAGESDVEDDLVRLPERRQPVSECVDIGTTCIEAHLRADVQQALQRPVVDWHGRQGLDHRERILTESDDVDARRVPRDGRAPAHRSGRLKTGGGEQTGDGRGHGRSVSRSKDRESDGRARRGGPADAVHAGSHDAARRARRLPGRAGLGPERLSILCRSRLNFPRSAQSVGEEEGGLQWIWRERQSPSGPRNRGEVPGHKRIPGA
jgi:hypothetical protein